MRWLPKLLGLGLWVTPPSRLGLLLMTIEKLGLGRCSSAFRVKKQMGMTSLLLP